MIIYPNIWNKNCFYEKVMFFWKYEGFMKKIIVNETANILLKYEKKNEKSVTLDKSIFF